MSATTRYGAFALDGIDRTRVLALFEGEADAGTRKNDEWNDLVILLGNTPWDGHRLGAQPLAEALATRVPVLYVDPPRSILRTRGTARIARLQPNLARVRTDAPPMRSKPGLRSLTATLSRRALESAVDRLGGDVRAMIAGPWPGAPYDCCNARTTIFRVSDDFAAGAGLIGRSEANVGSSEVRLAKAADALACVSPPLVEKWRSLGFAPTLIPNGCDAAHFANAPRLDRPSDIVVPDPIACFVGQLSTRIDFDLLRAVARSGVSLLLVGNMRSDLDVEDLADLLDDPRVQWIKGRPWADMPAYLGAAAVGLVPYTLSEFNRASFPLKLLEYLAAGRHVVSTSLPVADWLGTDHVTIADGPDAFADAVARRAGQPSDAELEESRQQVARAHSWENRAGDYLSLLDTLERRATPS
jgi:teichuronic acid biosynthesis glycosyltransferase TuaH